MERKHHALKKLLESVQKVGGEVTPHLMKELLHKPNKKTLDRLSLLVGFQNWEAFQEALHGDADAKTNYRE